MQDGDSGFRMGKKMLTEKKRRAVELLFECTEAEVARKLRISRRTLESWIGELEFRQAINGQINGNRRATVRMLSLLYLDSCRELSAIVHDKDDKTRHRVAVDILRASGLLKEGPEEEDGDGIEELLARLGEEEGATRG
jgi:hypothetical protein